MLLSMFFGSKGSHSRSRRDTPYSIEKMNMASKPLPSKSIDKNKKHRHSLSKAHLDYEDDPKLQYEAAMPLRSPTLRSKHPHNGQRRSHPRDVEETDDEQHPFEPEPRSGRKDDQHSPSPGAHGIPRHQAQTVTLHELTQLPVYEQVLRVRRHGISLSLGPEAIPALEDLAANGQLQHRVNNGHNPQNIEIDIHNPPPQEMQLMNEALVTLLFLGARLDIPALPPQIKCSFCGELFLARADKDEHTNRGRNTCQVCPAVLPCKTMQDEHMRQSHTTQGRPNLESPFNHKGSFHGRTESYWGEPSVH